MTEHFHFLLHKPFGYLSQFVNNQNKRRNKRLLGDLGPFPRNTMAIGRLDENSEGLLLLTTDGKVSEHIRSSSIEKEYYVQVDGVISDEAIRLLRSGLEMSIEGKKYTTKPCNANKLATPNWISPPRRTRDERHGPTSWLSITLTEGKFRQVRKMTAKVGLPTLRLIRVRIGNIRLQGLAEGTSRQVRSLLELVSEAKP